MHSDHENRVVLRAAGDVAGGAQRLAHRAQEMCDSNPIPAGRPTMNTNVAPLIACESVLDPILERLARVLERALSKVRWSRRRGTAAAAINRSRHQPDHLRRDPRDTRADTAPAPLGSR